MGDIKQIYTLGLDSINEDTGQGDTNGGCKIYKAIILTNELNREGTRASEQLLKDLAIRIIDKPVIKNHDWGDVDSTIGRVVSAEYIEEQDKKYVKAQFYVVDEGVKSKIDSGIYKGVSVGIECTELKDGTLDNLTDAFELSVVSVPAVQGASIVKMSKGVCREMDYEKLSAELQAEVDKLKKKCFALEKSLEDKEAEVFNAEAEGCLNDEIEEALEGLDLYSAEVKEAISDEYAEAVRDGKIVLERVDDEDGDEGVKTLMSGRKCRIEGLKEFSAKIKSKYTKLGLMGQRKVGVKDPVVVKKKELSFTRERDTDRGDNNTLNKTFGCTEYTSKVELK